LLALSDLLNRLFNLQEPPAAAETLLHYELAVMKLHRERSLIQHSTQRMPALTFGTKM
jgi:hypothetical protein